MDKKITTEQIIGLLKKAAKIKDRIIPLCSPVPRYQGRAKGYALCPKCYPNNLRKNEMQEWFRINDTDTRKQVKVKVEKLFERVAELEDKVKVLEDKVGVTPLVDPKEL